VRSRDPKRSLGEIQYKGWEIKYKAWGDSIQRTRASLANHYKCLKNMENIATNAHSGNLHFSKAIVEPTDIEFLYVGWVHGWPR